ncbi:MULTISPECIES: response regulator [unclassified Rhodococcus (in: high G+C Gram-positive bacteria)]|uniref:response regulator n=1 Tax=unclassified Rhodococcus (in: high G+C Gram-positive bacteria) TaxID=192944 RepID=UPI000B9B8877|nr:MULTISPECIES: response regulator transcription factor [unclassified Rhodococcus (in: high G+C Gram-positive bacteria)]MDV7991904.1 response regulator transcription factor [Rhodococcus sp. IEGM 1374]OZE36097.1 DNA-binding response regulator [Rhodococcus sp. 05-2254-4]OZE41263.1 DNA-binding response regulator [Rhodococcus sp. 05-2254-3]OZE44611.1 DNA-binding response regulator [Rhodococcus sp. 05-2254-2]OZF45346.1 DNA-binding response regulator [Rhodococcus sp. 14-1411-2a]
MRVIVAEDSTLLREGLVRLLVDEGHDVIASVGDAAMLLSAVEQDRPDIVVTDVRMPPGHSDEGLRAALIIRDRWPDVAVLVLSQYVENRYAAELISRSGGKVGYLLKDRVAQVDEFLDALNRVADGGTAFDPEVVRQLLSRTTRSNPLDRLTPRERDVLELMAQGLTNARIAADLYISVSSVEKHINAVFDKLGLANSSGMSRRVMAVVAYLRT